MNDYTDWLATYHDALTPGERARFAAAADAYFAQPHHAHRFDGSPYLDRVEDDAALTAILQTILDEGDLETAVHTYREAQTALTGWIRGAAALGASETAIAHRSGLARDTVRRRIGKM